MTPEEMTREIAEEMKHIFVFLDHRENKYRRAVLKARQFPLVFSPMFYRSPRKNTWLILVEAPNRAAIHSDMSKITFVCLFNHENGIYCFMPSWIDGKMHILVYVPHFFSRYASRFGLQMHGKELIAHFFRFNSSYVYDLKNSEFEGRKVIEVAGSTKHGVALGLAIEGGVLFKTFITYDMLKGEQIETFTRNEQYRKEIHEKE